ncbi:glycosyltransferase family 4 protein [Sulfurovum sp.]|uniref:glycosyltransferase family 4 protein n=1 Tax=Sulfurovum sp. TaxID=1969726 RepID=UPI0035684FEA
MNILYLCQVFEVGNDAGSERHFFFCKYAVSKGHSATAITSNVDYKNACVKIQGAPSTISRNIEGVDIHYVYSYANFRGSFLKRFYYFLTYFISTIVQSFKVKKVDVIYAVSTPLTVGLLGYVISRLRGIPFVFEVTDVWPDAPVACGVVKNKALIRLAHWLEMFCYKKAVHIIGLTRGICDNIITKGIDPKKVSIITNGVDFSLFNFAQDDSKRSEVRTRYGFGDKFVAMYMGAHGAYNALGTLIEAATILKHDPRFLFVFIGDGDEKPKLQQRTVDLGLTNVMFLKPVPRIESASLLSAADTFLLPNRKGEFFAGNLPNKLFDFLASARPVVVAGAGETPELVMTAECGRVGCAENSQSMAYALNELAMMPVEERMAMGARGRKYVLAHYDRSSLSEQFLKTLTDSVMR